MAFVRSAAGISNRSGSVKRAQFLKRSAAGLVAFVPAARALMNRVPSASAAASSVKMTISTFTKGDQRFHRLDKQGNLHYNGISLAQMRRTLGGDEGFLPDPFSGRMHAISLRSWAGDDPEDTFVQVRFLAGDNTSNQVQPDSCGCALVQSSQCVSLSSSQCGGSCGDSPICGYKITYAHYQTYVEPGFCELYCGTTTVIPQPCACCCGR